MKVVDAYTLDKATSIVPRAQMKMKIEEKQRNEKGQKKLLLTALDKFSKLTLELKEYRDLIENANEKAEFDALWGLDKHGNYKQQHSEDSNSNRSSILKVFDRVSSALKQKEGSPTIGDLIVSELESVEDVASMNEQKNPQSKEVVAELFQETIKSEEKKIEDSSLKFIHKKRRESIQQGISLAKKLDRLIYQPRRDSNVSMNSADYDLSSIDSHLSSAVEGESEEKRAYDRFDANKNAESGSGENSIAFSSNSDDSVNEIQKHRNAFANLTKTFQQGDQIAPAPAEIEDIGDDDDDDDQLYNLHLALDINDSSSASNSHDSLANEMRKEVNQTWQVVSLSNSSLASKFLGLADTRHRSYELQDLPPNEELDDDKDDTSSILLHQQKEDDDNDFSSLTHTNMDFPLTNSLKTKINVLKIHESSSNSFDDVSSIRLPVSEVSSSSFVSSLNQLKVRFPRPGMSLLEYLTSRR
eukprot:gene16644-18954_t